MKKKINAICVIVVFLSVVFLMTSCPNGVNIDKDNEQEQKKVLTFSCEGGNGTLTAEVNGESINSGVTLGTGIQLGNVIHFTAAPDNSDYTVDKWSGVDGNPTGKTATLTVNDISKNINVKVSFRKMTDDDKMAEILKKVKITNDSFNVFKLGEYPSEDELSAIEGEIDTIFEDGNTASAWLGLARKEGDNKLYLIAKDIEGTKPVDTINFMANLSSLQKACEDITKKYRPGLDITHHLISPTGNTDLCFESVKQALEWRWQNMKKDFPDSSSPSPTYENTCNPFFFCDGSKPWLTFYPDTLKEFIISDSVLYFAVKTEEKDPEVYFRNGDGEEKRTIDFTLTFVKGYEVYVFKFGSYFLNNEENEYLYKNLDGKDGSLLMLKLSSLVRLSLEKQLMDNGISEDVAKDKAKEYVKDFEPFKNDFADLKSWDVYLTVGEMLEGIYTDGMNPLGVFRNTFKLTGDDAKEFWKQ